MEQTPKTHAPAVAGSSRPDEEAPAYPPAPLSRRGDPDDEYDDGDREEMMGRMAPLPVSMAAGLLAAAVLFACLTGKMWYDLREDYKAAARVTRTANISPNDMPADPGVYAALALAYSRDFMPPDNARARDLVGEAVRLAPLDSIYWLRLAELNLLLGEREAAVAALRMSDVLDPRWPDQRLDAIRLWRILGDRKRALELAGQIARLGPGFRERVARELLDNQIPTPEVLDALAFRDRSPEEMGTLISAMASSPGVSLDDLWRSVPKTAREDGQLRGELARLARQRGRYELLLELWALDKDPLATLAPGLVVKNTDLRRSPLGQTFELGWQPPVDATDVRTVWMAPESPTGGTGKLDIDIGAFAPEELMWPVYTLVIPADMAVEVGARLSVNPAVRTVAEVRVNAGKDWFAGKTTASANDKPEDIRYAIPPADEPRIAVVFVAWRRVGLTDSLSGSSMAIHALLVRSLPRFEPTAATTESGS